MIIAYRLAWLGLICCVQCLVLYSYTGKSHWKKAMLAKTDSMVVMIQTGRYCICLLLVLGSGVVDVCSTRVVRLSKLRRGRRRAVAWTKASGRVKEISLPFVLSLFHFHFRGGARRLGFSLGREQGDLTVRPTRMIPACDWLHGRAMKGNLIPMIPNGVLLVIVFLLCIIYTC